MVLTRPLSRRPRRTRDIQHFPAYCAGIEGRQDGSGECPALAEPSGAGACSGQRPYALVMLSARFFPGRYAAIWCADQLRSGYEGLRRHSNVSFVTGQRSCYTRVTHACFAMPGQGVECARAITAPRPSCGGRWLSVGVTSSPGIRSPRDADPVADASELPKAGGVAIQGEDEIASIGRGRGRCGRSSSVDGQQSALQRAHWSRCDDGIAAGHR